MPLNLAHRLAAEGRPRSFTMRAMQAWDTWGHNCAGRIDTFHPYPVEHQRPARAHRDEVDTMRLLTGQNLFVSMEGRFAYNQGHVSVWSSRRSGRCIFPCTSRCGWMPSKAERLT
jgi:hypothetical protein